MPLAIEPLHPMQVADRACVNTLKHAPDLCDELDAGKTGALGVALDIHRVWWDLLLDRGMMGDGVVELKKFAAG